MPQAQKAASHSTAWAEHLPSGLTWVSCHPICSCFQASVQPASLTGTFPTAATHLHSSAWSSAFWTNRAHLSLAIGKQLFSSVFYSFQRGPTLELYGPQEFNRSGFSSYRILWRIGLRDCYHLYPEPAFSSFNLIHALSYLTHGFRYLLMLLFFILFMLFS